MPKNEKIKRSKVHQPGLNTNYHSRVRREYMDQDYSSQLSEEEKDWLSQFNEEYYGAALDYENLENNLHNNKRLKKDCTDRNNSRNRCVYGIAKAQGKLLSAIYSIIKEEDEDSSDPNIENVLINYIDSKNED